MPNFMQMLLLLILHACNPLLKSAIGVAKVFTNHGLG
jgi:hypothetical protein